MTETLITLRCVNCGMVCDALILYNQSDQEVGARLASRSKVKKTSCRLNSYKQATVKRG